MLDTPQTKAPARTARPRLSTKHVKYLTALVLTLTSGMLAPSGTAVGGLAPADKTMPDHQPSHVSQAQTAPGVDVNPDSLDFSDQVVRKSSPPQRLTVTNTGGAPLYVSSTAVRGDEWEDFNVSKDTCTGATVAPGQSCVVDVKFTPRDTGDRDAKLVVTDNAPDSPQEVPLTGVGINSVDVPPAADRSR